MSWPVSFFSSSPSKVTDSLMNRLSREAARSARNRASPWSLVGSGRVGLSGIGQHPPLPRMQPAGALAAVDAAGALELAAVAAAGPLLCEEGAARHGGALAG